MTSDIDIVRCAAPWPGLAAQLLESLSCLGEGSWSLERICSTTPASFAPGDAEQVLAGLAVAGICVRDAAGWSSAINSSESSRIVALLRGADHFRRLRMDAPNLELAVTMPMSPSHLEERLASTLGKPGGYLPTPQAFTRIASTAKERFVVMTPFLNRVGFRWLRRVFEATTQEPQRVLILRDVSKYAIDLSVHHADWLRALNVSVFDYNLPHNSDMGRALPVETFHAKVLLADSKLAYVGSANILGSGDGTSLEVGVLVDGSAANQVGRLIDGIMGVAKKL